MKASILAAVASLACLATPLMAQAQGAAKVPQCQAPFAACQAAGFKVGAHKKGDKEGTDNGLWVDCIDAVADGKKQVSGVAQADAQACKAAIKASKGH